MLNFRNLWDNRTVGINRLLFAIFNWFGDFTLLLLFTTGAYLATHESQNFGGDTPKKGTTPKLKFSNITDFDKQIVYIRVTALLSPDISLVLGWAYSFTVILALFGENYSKTSLSESQSNTPLICYSNKNSVRKQWPCSIIGQLSPNMNKIQLSHGTMWIPDEISSWAV